MKTTLLTIGLALAIASCSSSKKEEKAETSDVKDVAEATSSANGISDYMTLKDALVQTDASAAKSAASKLVESATSENWSAAIIEAAGTIANSIQMMPTQMANSLVATSAEGNQS